MSLAQTISLPQGEKKPSLPLMTAKPGFWKTLAGGLWKFLEKFGHRRAEHVIDHAKKHGFYY